MTRKEVEFIERHKAGLLNPDCAYYIGDKAREAVKEGRVALQNYTTRDKIQELKPKKKTKRQSGWNLNNEYDGRNDFHTFGYPDSYWM